MTAIHRYYADLDNPLDDANSPYPFDPAAVRALKGFPLQGNAMQEYSDRRLAYRNEYEYNVRSRESYAKPVEIWEYHGLVPAEFAQNGIRHRCIAIGNQKVVLKNREGPMANQQKPFLSYCPMRDPYGFDGIGKAEVAYGPQRTADRLSNPEAGRHRPAHGPPDRGQQSGQPERSEPVLKSRTGDPGGRPGRRLEHSGPSDEPLV
jgi:hypothetical protein